VENINKLSKETVHNVSREECTDSIVECATPVYRKYVDVL
jgi:hypothetical protein